jgi:RNA polymerase-binding transcription factor DksA
VDSAELAQERENDEVLDAIGHETVQSIREVRAALQRIDDGTYAVCEACEATIPEARLEALPETTLCVDCAE